MPGPGKILADGQVLTAGGYRCFVTGFAVTCSGQATSLGFSVSQVAYLLYPRDGTAPEPGQPVLQPTTDAHGADVIGPDGYEDLRLGMTLSQAQQADPTLVVESSSRCVQAATKDAKRVVFLIRTALWRTSNRAEALTPLKVCELETPRTRHSCCTHPTAVAERCRSTILAIASQ